jgi:hypothetical protein
MIDAASVRARTDDGQTVEIEWRMLRVSPGESPAMPPTGRRGWMPPVGVWSTARVGAGESEASLAPGEMAAEFAVLTLPQGTLGQGVWMEGSGIGDGASGVRLEVNWLASSVSLAERAGGTVLDPPLKAEEAASPLIRASLDDESTSPFRRWRARLARGMLMPTESAGPAREAAVDAFADPVLEEIAAQMQERWTVALLLLEQADAAMASRVRAGLVLTANVGQGVVAPAWPTDQGVLDELLAGLLAPRATRSQRLIAAENFLRTIPEAVARIADDAHALDAVTLAPVVVIAATNLTDRPLAASALWPRSLAAPDLIPIAPRGVARLVLPTDAETVASRPAWASVVVGDWRGKVPASPVATGVVPPGLFLGSMSPDLSKDEWLGWPADVSQAGVPPVAVTIIRAPSPNPRERAHSEGWVLYGESAPGVEGVVRVWLGTTTSGREPLVVVTGTPLPPGADGAASPGTKRTFSIPIPAEAVTRGTLLIGVDATVSLAGRESHWAWPRAMFPWQNAPSRAALDLSAWGGVAAPTGSR